MDELAARFRRGDPDAVREVYRRHAGAVLTVARSIVRDPDLAADVVQQTFMKAWRAAASFEGERELSPWLYSIARRTAIDVVRADARRAAVSTDPATIDAHGDDRPTATISFERTWEIHEVRTALDALPADEREVLRRSHLLGQSHREIAELLGVPIGTVKSRTARGHRRLALALAHLDPDGDANHPADAGVLDDEGRNPA